MLLFLNLILIALLAHYAYRATRYGLKLAEQIDQEEYTPSGFYLEKTGRNKTTVAFRPNEEPFHHGFDGIEEFDTTAIVKRIKGRKS